MISHELDDATLDRLNAYLAKEMKGQITVPVTLSKFAHGQSNPTFLVEDSAGRKFVLRRKPPGESLSSTAHNVEREYTIISALCGYNEQQSDPARRVPVPQVYCLCKDPAVIGNDFYIMEFCKGRIFTDARLKQLPKSERAAYWKELVRAQATLARVDPYQLKLPSNFIKNEPFYKRQIRSYERIARDQAKAKDVDTGEEVGLMPGFEEAIAYFKRTIPTDINDKGICHGDFKMDNVVFHPTEPRIVALLDWELVAFGAPLTDFINGTSPFFRPSRPDDEGGQLGFDGEDMSDSGLPTFDELLRIWCEGAGVSYPPQSLNWCVAWHFIRGSTILQGIAARYARRQNSSTKAQLYGAGRFPNMKLVLKHIELDKQSSNSSQKAHL